MLRAPASFRETVILFGQLRGDQPVGELFARVDWSSASARQLIHAFLDRAPVDGAEAAEPPDFDPAALALALFQSPDFRVDLAGRILRHFPGKQRLLFVHIPKSAGNDFVTAMNRVYPRVSNELSDSEVLPPPQLAIRLGHFARKIGDASAIFMAGHIRLSAYLDQGLFRFTDRLFTILRDPNEICVSLANYVTARFTDCPDLSAQDTRVWGEMLGITAADLRAIEPRALALALAARPGIQPINPICSLLGDGTARGTLDNLQRASIEITSRAQYSDWLRETWNMDWNRRVNSSPQLIAWSDLDDWQQARIRAGNAEDRIVFDLIAGCLARTGSLSVTGGEVAEAASRQGLLF